MVIVDDVILLLDGSIEIAPFFFISDLFFFFRADSLFFLEEVKGHFWGFFCHRNFEFKRKIDWQMHIYLNTTQNKTATHTYTHKHTKHTHSNHNHLT